MKPSLNRNRTIELVRTVQLAHAYRLQLNEKQCTQKESNLQPAVANRIADGRESGFSLRGIAKFLSDFHRSIPEPVSANRFQSVTAPSPLAARPDLLAACQELMVRGPKVWQ